MPSTKKVDVFLVAVFFATSFVCDVGLILVSFGVKNTSIFLFRRCFFSYERGHGATQLVQYQHPVWVVVDMVRVCFFLGCRQQYVYIFVLIFVVFLGGLVSSYLEAKESTARHPRSAAPWYYTRIHDWFRSVDGLGFCCPDIDLKL